MLEIRSAGGHDLDAVVSLTRSMRRRLAEWAPVYFNPSEGADEGHAAFLGFLLDSADHDTFVVVDGAEVVGFFTRVSQDLHVWIDDLSLEQPRSDDTEQWREVVRAIMGLPPARWVTCVSSQDHVRLVAMKAEGLVVASTYYARSLTDVGAVDSAVDAAVDGAFDRAVGGGVASSTTDDGFTPGAAPTHTFGGRSFSAELPGALVISDGDGRVVGSPSATPPIYDPGGPTCVVDRIDGNDRRSLLDRAIRMAAGRGDAQLVVVCDAADHRLESILAAEGFDAVVQLLVCNAS